MCMCVCVQACVCVCVYGVLKLDDEEKVKK